MLTIELDGRVVEVVGDVEWVQGRRGRELSRRGRSAGRGGGSRPLVRVRLEQRPGPDLLALRGNYAVVEVDGVTRRDVRIGVQVSPASVVVEWAP
jgi:hypothetical protein